MKVKIPAYVKVTIALTLANLLILAIRNMAVGNAAFNFLKSNLFIGSFPTILIAFLLQRYYTKINNFVFWLGTILWLIFYPNAPYMISDLIHDSADPLDATNPEMIVYDTLIIFSIAMLSVFYGFLSLKIMFNLFRVKYGNRFANIAITLTLLLSCFGFFMGRELKSAIALLNGYLYSWEIFLEPVQIIKIVWSALFPISSHLPAYAMMALFGAVQYMLLVMFKDVSDIESGEVITKQ